MRLLILCFNILLLTQQVIGGKHVAPYQTMLFWYAYRVDVKTLGALNTEIAAGCRGTAPGKGCTFDEFLQHIDAESPKHKYSGSGVDADNFDPDVLDTAERIGQRQPNRAKYSNLYNAHTLFPGQWDSEKKVPYHELIDKIAVNLQARRAAAVADGTIREIVNEYDSATQAMIAIHTKRMREQAGFIIDYINGKLKAKGVSWTVETRPQPDVDATTYREFDSQATLDAHGDASNDLRTYIRDFMVDGKKEFKEIGRHQWFISEVQKAVSRLLNAREC